MEVIHFTLRKSLHANLSPDWFSPQYVKYVVYFLYLQWWQVLPFWVAMVLYGGTTSFSCLVVWQVFLDMSESLQLRSGYTALGWVLMTHHWNFSLKASGWLFVHLRTEFRISWFGVEAQVLEIFQLSWIGEMAEFVNLQGRDSVAVVEDDQLELELSFYEGKRIWSEEELALHWEIPVLSLPQGSWWSLRIRTGFWVCGSFRGKARGCHSYLWRPLP